MVAKSGSELSESKSAGHLSKSEFKKKSKSNTNFFSKNFLSVKTI